MSNPSTRQDGTATPGPWTLRIDREAVANSSARFFVMAGKYVLAETKVLPPRMTEEAEANARLFAAAPDLLAACKKVVEHYGDPASGDLFGLRAAIAKAEGQS